MINSSQSHLFWGSSSPLATLSCGGLLIMATVRFSYAIIISGSLLWVYCLSVLVSQSATRIFPRRGVFFLQTFLTSVMAGIFLLLLWLVCPLAAIEVFFIVSLVPLFCIFSGIFQRIKSLDLSEAVTLAATESAVICLLLLILSLIREPLGLLSLSLPGGSQGIVFIFSGDSEALLPMRIIASSSGALLLLGYCVGLYRHYRGIIAPGETGI